MALFNNKKPAEYEEYIKKIVLSYENKLSDQKDRIFALIEENKRLLSQLDEFKEKDRQISKTLMVAVQKAKEIEDAAKAKYNMEIERLKLFHIKWTSYYQSIKAELAQSEDIIKVENFLKKMDEILGFSQIDEAAKQYRDESLRLGGAAGLRDDAAAVDGEYEGIDMEEVLNPKDLPELGEIIKQMGILNK
jgi:hypothetical protein